MKVSRCNECRVVLCVGDVCGIYSGITVVMVKDDNDKDSNCLKIQENNRRTKKR